MFMHFLMMLMTLFAFNASARYLTPIVTMSLGDKCAGCLAPLSEMPSEDDSSCCTALFALSAFARYLVPSVENR